MEDPAFVVATRSSYDAIAKDYATWVDDELDARPLDRAFMGGFVELVKAAGGGSVADIGCGPGRITGHLTSLGIDAFGIDLSPAMIAQARLRYPDLQFDVSSMLELDLPAASLGGIVAWYSVIHVPDDQLPDVLRDFHQALVPGGHVLLGFQVGDEVVHRSEARGNPVDLTFHRRTLTAVCDLLTAAGFAIVARLLREPDDNEKFPEKSPQGFIIAKRVQA